MIAANLDAICTRIRPSFGELMAMDWPLASAIVERLPSLDDGVAGQALIQIFGGKKR